VKKINIEIFAYWTTIIYPQISKIYLSISNICLLLFFIYTISYHDFLDFTSNLILPYHTGVLIAVFLCLICVFKYLITSKNIFLYLFAILSIITNISDGLISIYLCIPLFLTLLIVLVSYKTNYKKVIKKLFWFNIISVVIGYGLQKLIQPIFYVSFNGLGFISKASIIGSYNLMILQDISYFISGGVRSLTMYLSLLSFISSGIISFYLIKKNKNQKKPLI